MSQRMIAIVQTAAVVIVLLFAIGCALAVPFLP